jgi:hypothetical protein
VFTSFVLIIIDHLRNQRLSTRFFAPKFIFFSILIVVEITYPILYNGWEVVPHGLVFFVIWFAATMCQKLDQTERFKFNTDAFVFAVVITLNVADPILNHIPVLRNSCGLFSSLHSFVLLMIFSHWPYEFAAEEADAKPVFKWKKPQNP